MERVICCKARCKQMACSIRVCRKRLPSLRLLLSRASLLLQINLSRRKNGFTYVCRAMPFSRTKSTIYWIPSTQSAQCNNAAFVWKLSTQIQAFKIAFTVWANECSNHLNPSTRSSMNLCKKWLLSALKWTILWLSRKPTSSFLWIYSKGTLKALCKHRSWTLWSSPAPRTEFSQRRSSSNKKHPPHSKCKIKTVGIS